MQLSKKMAYFPPPELNEAALCAREDEVLREIADDIVARIKDVAANRISHDEFLFSFKLTGTPRWIRTSKVLRFLYELLNYIPTMKLPYYITFCEESNASAPLIDIDLDSGDLILSGNDALHYHSKMHFLAIMEKNKILM